MNVTIHEESAAAETLVCDVLRQGGPIAAEYPLVFDERFPGRLVAIEDDENGVLSTCAVLPRELVLPDARFRIGLIGSVVTHADHRGRGLSQEVLASAERSIAEAGGVFSLLWADEPEFYAKRGYVPIGTELDYVVGREAAHLLPDPTGMREARPEDSPRMHELYETHDVRVVRTPDETAALLAGPGIETLVRQRDGVVVAYSCVGRGEDLRDVVHEWAGSAEDALALLHGHMERLPADVEELIMMVPPQAMDVREYFELVRTPGARGILGMAKLVNVDAAGELLLRFTGGRGTVRRVDDERLMLMGPTGETVMYGEDLLLTLVAPKGDRGVVEAIERLTGLELPGLPLKPFVWGLDSI